MFKKIKTTVLSSLVLLIIAGGGVALASVLGWVELTVAWQNYYLFAQIIGIFFAVTVCLLLVIRINKK